MAMMKVLIDEKIYNRMQKAYGTDTRLVIEKLIDEHLARLDPWNPKQ